jgi:hypothetical protein
MIFVDPICKTVNLRAMVYIANYRIAFFKLLAENSMYYINSNLIAVQIIKARFDHINFIDGTTLENEECATTPGNQYTLVLIV